MLFRLMLQSKTFVDSQDVTLNKEAFLKWYHFVKNVFLPREANSLTVASLEANTMNE